MVQIKMIFKVTRQVSPVDGEVGWYKPPWKDIPAALIRNYMGPKPEHFPKAEVKLIYDDKAISLLKKFCSVVPPAENVVWRANFYKCGDQTSHPHWLTWAEVDCPQPNFHLPRFFDRLAFE
jgi:hypothetical protein